MIFYSSILNVVSYKLFTVKLLFLIKPEYFDEFLLVNFHFLLSIECTLLNIKNNFEKTNPKIILEELL